MTKDIFDNDLHSYLEDEEKKCKQCGAPIQQDKEFCSKACWEYYME